MKHSQTRLAVAACLAPVLGCVVTAVALGFWFLTAAPEYEHRPSLASTFGFAAYGGLIAGLVLGWPTMIVAGLPTHAALWRRARTTPLPYAIAGALVGLLPAAVLEMLMVGARAEPQHWAFALALGAATGVVCALLFWLIRRPDRAAANPLTPAP